MIDRILIAMMVGCILLISCESFSDEILKSVDIKDLPSGTICYDEASQIKLDEALANGIEAKKNLYECRIWRDKYKQQLKDLNEPVDESPLKKEVSKRQFFIPLLLFISGVLIGGNVF